MDSLNVALTPDEIAVVQKAFSHQLAFLSKKWQHRQRIGEKDAAANLFEQADDVRTLMNKVGAAPLNLRVLS